MGDYLTTREAFQGLILPDSRWQPWTAETTATSAGGRPSITSSSALQLATVDVDRGAPGQTLTLECERSGVPAPPDGHQAAGYLVTHSSDSTELGLDEPLQFTGVSAPIFSGATGTQISMATTSREG